MLQAETNSAPSQRLGRTALIVLFVTLATSGALAAIQNFGGLDQYDRGVLKILSGAAGMVGSLWAVVLLLRGARRGERVLLALAIFLAAFCAVSFPMIRTWNAPDRGLESSWDYLHLACLPLLVPLITASVLFALPLFVWRYRCSNRAEEAAQPGLRWRAWRTLLIAAAVLFAALLPFAFYIYGGSMSEVVGGRHWTTRAVDRMPRWIGDAGFAWLERLPNKAAHNARRMLLVRGLVSPEFMIRRLEDPGAVEGQEELFNNLERNYRNEALAWVRGRLASGAPENLTREMIHCFTQFGNDAEVRALLELKRFDALDLPQKLGAWQGLRARNNGSAFVGDMEALMDGSPETCMQALNFLFGEMDGTDARRIYLKAIERGPEVLLHATYHLRSTGNGVVAGLQLPDPMKQRLVMQALMMSSSSLSVRTKLRENLHVYRIAFQQVLNGGDYVNRVMAALLIHETAQALTPALIAQYNMQPPGQRRLSMDPLHIHAAGVAQNQELIEQARELLKQ